MNQELANLFRKKLRSCLILSGKGEYFSEYFKGVSHFGAACLAQQRLGHPVAPAQHFREGPSRPNRACDGSWNSSLDQ